MSVSCSYSKLQAYIMKIALPFQREDLVNKIKELVQFDSYNNRVLIEFLSNINNQDLQAIMLDIMLEFNKFRFVLLGVINNDHINHIDRHHQYKLLLNQFNIPVIDAINIKKSNQNKSQHQKQFNKSNILYIDRPVRNGVRVEHNDDIVVCDFVSNQAEVISSGSVMVYGTCRGRIIAGHPYNVRARIIINNFCAELVAIAGIFKVFSSEEANSFNGSIMVTVDGDSLKFKEII